MPFLSLLALILVLSTLSSTFLASAITCPDGLLTPCSKAAFAAGASGGSCCSYPRLSLNQVWQPEVGEGSWLIDSLSSEDCEGSLLRSCNPSRAYKSEEIQAFLLASIGQGVLDRELEGDWSRRDSEAVEETLERVWGVHGTCIRPFAPDCSPDGIERGSEVPTYFLLAHALQQSLNTAALLEKEDITPSTTISYSLDSIRTALSRSGYMPILRCSSNPSSAEYEDEDDEERTYLSGVSYPLAMIGRPEHPSFVPRSASDVSAKGHAGRCPSDGIYLLPSISSLPIPKPSLTQAWDPIFRPSPRPITLSSSQPSGRSGYYDQPELDSPKIPEGKLGLFGLKSRERVEKKEKKAEGLKGGRVGRDEL